MSTAPGTGSGMGKAPLPRTRCRAGHLPPHALPVGTRRAHGSWRGGPALLRTPRLGSGHEAASGGDVERGLPRMSTGRRCGRNGFGPRLRTHPGSRSHSQSPARVPKGWTFLNGPRNATRKKPLFFRIFRHKRCHINNENKIW